MIQIDLLTLIGLLLLAFGVAAAVLVTATYFPGKRSRRIARFDPHRREPAVFLFDQGLLVDATERANAILAGYLPGADPWTRFLAYLAETFPEATEQVRALPRDSRMEICGGQDALPARLTAEWRNGLLRVTVVEIFDSGGSLPVEAQNLRVMERDTRLLGGISAHAPGLIWASTPGEDGITWANAAYSALVGEVRGEEAAATWPLPALFPDWDPAVPTPQKLSIQRRGSERPSWFDVTSAAIGQDVLHFGTPVDATIDAERALRDTVQTLAKTFAHLPIGLAIFDRDRRLVLFNPALTDLSALPVRFLGDRPTLTAFLDELRNRQFMPEPKDYKSWRQKITELESEAQRGTYAETWSLPDGRTFRVTGRPHPERAIAFLFEDISDEIALTRRFRKDMQLGQAILDALPEALVVFSRGGTMTMANAAYAELWGIDPGASLGEVGITDASRRWIARSRPTPVWGDIRDFVTAISNRSEWSGVIELLDGKTYDLHCTPLPAGDTLIAFAENSRSVPENIPAAHWSA